MHLTLYLAAVAPSVPSPHVAHLGSLASLFQVFDRLHLALQLRLTDRYAGADQLEVDPSRDKSEFGTELYVALFSTGNLSHTH